MIGQRKEAGVTFLKKVESLAITQYPEAQFITDKKTVNKGVIVRARRISGDVADQKAFSLYRIDIKCSSDEECIADDILDAILLGLHLSTEQHIIQGFIALCDIEGNPLGDHIRITPNGSRLYQEITGDVGKYHLQMTLRVYHD